MPKVIECTPVKIIIADADFKKTVQESIILPLLRNKVYERDLRPEELVDGDIEAILLFLRNSSFGISKLTSANSLNSSDSKILPCINKWLSGETLRSYSPMALFL